MLLVWSYLLFTLGQVALQNASQIASKPHPVGTQEDKRAADTVASILTNCGLTPKRHTFSVVEAPGVEALGKHFLSPLEAHFDGQNIWARIGPDDAPAILIGAHYDSVSIRGPGARDNAAGVGVILAAACALKDQWRGKHSLVFVAFDGEEAHLLGSRAFLRDKPAGEISMVLSLDILGSDNLSLNGLSPLVGSSLVSAALSAADETNISLAIPFAQLVISRFIPEGERSDHGPFTAAKIPAFQLYSRGPYGFDPYYHSPKDDVSRLSEDSLDDAARWIVAFLPRADGAISSNDGRFFPLGSSLLPTWIVLFFMGASLTLALLSLVSSLQRKETKSSLLRVAASWLVWLLVSLVLALGFFAPFWLGRLVQGVSLPWLYAIFWYTLAGVLCSVSLLLLLASIKRLAKYFEGAEGFCTLGLISLLGAFLFLWGVGAVEAAAPISLALFFAAIAGFFTGRGRLVALLSVLIGAALLSPWRYVEGVLAWTLAGSSWLYFFVVWAAILVFGAVALGARSSEPKVNKAPNVWVLIASWLVSACFCVVAARQDAYNNEIPRRSMARIVYQESDAYILVRGFYGEVLDGLSLKIAGDVQPLSGDHVVLPFPAKDLGLFSSQESTLQDGTKAFLLELKPIEKAFVAVVFTYSSEDKQGRSVPFQYRVEHGDWKEITSPLGLRVGFYGPPGEVKDTRAFQVAPNATLKVSVSAELPTAPEEISFVEQPFSLFEIGACLEFTRTLIP